MDLPERIARRRNRRFENSLVVDWEAINPAAHLPEPTGRGAMVEAVLDAINPVFEQALPPNVYVWGEGGSGKSAIVSTLMAQLDDELSSPRTIYTATRGEQGLSDIRFLYVDARQASSRFQLYQRTLDAIRAEPVPKRGLSTDQLQAQIEAELTRREGVLVAVDHLGEPATFSVDKLHSMFEPFEGIAWIAIGRTSPGNLSLPIPESQVLLPPYTSYELVDILTERSTRGLSQPVDTAILRDLADWADGNAHDALAALYIAALEANSANRTRISETDVEAGKAAVPKDGIPIGRVFTISANKRSVLRHLLATSTNSETTIDEAAVRIAESADLTTSTVKRLLYELAQDGILERVRVSVGRQAVGRQPSTPKPNFPIELFERMYDG